MEKKEVFGILDILGDYGKYVCNIGREMDRLKISITKMRKLTGLNHEIVKKYYTNEIQRVDKEVFAKLTHIILLYGGSIDNLLEYVPPKKDKNQK